MVDEQVVIHKNEGMLQDSLSMGSSAKNCEIKVYANFSDLEETKKRIDQAVDARAYLMDKVKTQNEMNQ